MFNIYYKYSYQNYYTGRNQKSACASCVLLLRGATSELGRSMIGRKENCSDQPEAAARIVRARDALWF